MKKNILLIIAITTLSACVKSPADILPNSFFSVVAKTEDPTKTKTTVEGGNHVYWEPGDEILIFSEGKQSKFTTEITESSPTATFSGSLGENVWSEGKNLWAVYPFNEDVVLDGETITATLPAEQVARAGSFGKDVNLAVALSTTAELQFKNVGGGIRFSVKSNNIKKITFSGKQNEVLAGKVKIKMDENGNPFVQEVIEPQSAITLTAPGNGCFVPGQWYFFVSLPCGLHSGYTITGETDTGKSVTIKDSSSDVVVKRKVFGSMSNLSSVYNITSIIGEIVPISTDQDEVPAYDWKLGDRIAVLHGEHVYLFEADNSGYSTSFHLVEGQESFAGADGDAVYAVSPDMEITNGCIVYDNYNVFDYVTKYSLANERLPLPVMRGEGLISNGTLHLTFSLINSYLKVNLDKETRDKNTNSQNNNQYISISGVFFTLDGCTYNLVTHTINHSAGTPISFIYDYHDNPETLLNEDVYSFYYAVNPDNYSDLTLCVYHNGLSYGVFYETLNLLPNSLSVVEKQKNSTSISDGDFNNPPIISW